MGAVAEGMRKGRQVAGAAPVIVREGSCQTRLLVSVVSHGHGVLLAALLDDLSRAVGVRDRIVVTLNIAESEAFDRRRWPDVEWIDNPRPKGFGANHNHALLGRHAEWLAIVNPDIRLAPDSLSRLIDNAIAGGVAMTAPVIVDPEGALQDSARALLTPASLVGRLRGRLSRARGRPGPSSSRIDWLAGMLLVVRSDAFAAVRGFDERFFLYCEDMDLSLRLQLAGYNIAYDRGVVAVHDARRDSHRNSRHLRLHLASLLKSWATPAFWRFLLERRRRGALAMAAPPGRTATTDSH